MQIISAQQERYVADEEASLTNENFSKFATYPSISFLYRVLAANQAIL